MARQGVLAGFEKGDRKDRWAITISGPWRLVFKFRDGDAYEVEIVDYH